MNKQAQVGIGAFLLMFITVLVGAVLLVASAGEIGKSTTTFDRTNESRTSGANASFDDFTGFKEISSVVIFNYTNGTSEFNKIMDEGSDYLIFNNVVVNGAEVARVQVLM